MYDISGVILSGGKNIRMGKNKAFLDVGGRKIIDRTAKLFRETFRQVILVTNEPLEYSYLNLEIVSDIIPGSGPLIGIYSGLSYSSYPCSFVVACDMPFINRKIIDYMVTMEKYYDVIVPHLSDGYHPLHACYSTKCIKFIEELISSGNLKITNFFKKVAVREITSNEIKLLDPSMNCILNLNTPEDLAKIKVNQYMR